MCQIGTNNVSALIFPPSLGSQIMWTFVIWAPECQMLALRFKVHKHAKEPKSNWNHTDSNIMDCMSKTEPVMLQQSPHFRDKETEDQREVTCSLMSHSKEIMLPYTIVLSPQGTNPAEVLCCLLLLF